MTLISQKIRVLFFSVFVHLCSTDRDGDLDVGLADVDVEEFGSCLKVPGNERQFALLRHNGSGSLNDPWLLSQPQNFQDESVHVHDFAFLDVNGDGCKDLFLATCDGVELFINRTAPCQQAAPGP